MKNQRKFVISVLALVWVLFSALTARAFVAHEVKPGFIELQARGDNGLLVTSVQTRFTRHKKKWVYFCVSESTSLFRKTASENKEKCFFGQASKFHGIKVNQSFKSIQYKLLKRVYNDRGHIAIGAKRYFYLAQNVKITK